MAASTDELRSALEHVAVALLDDIDGIGRRSVARMQKTLPSYAEVPAEVLVAVTLTNARNLLEAVLDSGTWNSSRGAHPRRPPQRRDHDRLADRSAR